MQYKGFNKLFANIISENKLHQPYNLTDTGIISDNPNLKIRVKPTPDQKKIRITIDNRNPNISTSMCVQVLDLRRVLAEISVLGEILDTYKTKVPNLYICMAEPRARSILGNMILTVGTKLPPTRANYILTDMSQHGSQYSFINFYKRDDRQIKGIKVSEKKPHLLTVPKEDLDGWMEDMALVGSDRIMAETLLPKLAIELSKLGYKAKLSEPGDKDEVAHCICLDAEKFGGYDEPKLLIRNGEIKFANISGTVHELVKLSSTVTKGIEQCKGVMEKLKSVASGEDRTISDDVDLG